MNNWKHYAGSVLLAGLLLQGCSDAPTEDTPTAPVNTNAQSSALTANTLSALVDGQTVQEAKLAYASGEATASADAKAKIAAIIAALVADGSLTQEDADALLKSDLNELYMTAYFDAYAEIKGMAPAPKRIFGIGTALKDAASKVTDKVKDGLVDAMDSTAGDAITGAVFDVVLNSEGVTVFMLDQARNSETMTQIMIDALDANWDLTKKMCPMLQTNAEFGEKFAALAEERESMAHFFFQSVDANMYGCLTDAMLLSNNDAVHHESVSHSTNAYMGILLDRYATTYFITPDQATNPNGYENGASTFKFAGLMMDNGENVIYNRDAKTFENHGDGNELTNEQFFYSLFKTPGTTDAFVSAMDQLDPAVTTMFMDKIFLGAPGAAETDDTVQGYLNIVSIGSAMYDGIYGEKNAEGVRVNAYGFGSYTNAFIGFAGLIPADRYLAYGKAFVDAGYEYAAYNGVNVWDSVTNTAQAAWDDYTAPDAAAPAPSRSAGLGTLGSDWLDDSLDILLAAWSNVSLSDLFDALVDGDKSVLAELNDQGSVAYSTVIDGRNDANETVYPTVITNPLFVENDTVYGFHGLIELAMREDIYNTNHELNASYQWSDAEAAFTLPLFADLTWSFAYTAATDGAVAYYNSFVDAGWLADLSTNELVREYFYPSADNVYIPSWLLAIDWLQLPDNFNNANIADTDFNFDAGFMDIYVVSTNDNLIASLDLPQAADPLKTITMEKVEMGSDSIIVVDESGVNENGLHVYKVRVVSAEDTAAVLAYLNGLVDSGLTAIGIDSTNATETVATEG